MGNSYKTTSATYRRNSLREHHGCFHQTGTDGIGDLSGLISRLDYLNDGNPAGGNDLGVDALWLMPVVENNMRRSASNGG